MVEIDHQGKWNDEFKEESRKTLFKSLQERKRKERETKFREILNGSKPEENTAFARYRNGPVKFETTGNFSSCIIIVKTFRVLFLK